MPDRPGAPAERSSSGAGRPNPEPFEGSLVWWIEVPGSQQNYLQAVLEGHEELGYYQTLDQCVRRGPDRRAVALGRITSTPDMRGRLEALLRVLSGECGVTLPDRAPDFRPDEKPGARARGKRVRGG
ncbi:MAG: hypothetical protein A3J27_11830 [Candidatus Tectomicrobia bacterium RIFCSPLOWO2_12_FULL_69_37]|nr:MAG: hypothetical protein A3J27_11830 [Candidatus Tectomicrobia bacterium RIFCSPLOWO2_12_FULL_69_37]